MTLRIGTRKSPLAMAQAQEVALALGGECELVPMSTTGDEITSKPLADIGGKGLFTKELEEALADGRVDMAVHSLKDVPTVLPDGLVMAATLPREDVRDVLISHDARRIADLPEGTRFGTSSLRRAAQLLHMRPDMEIVPFRGNVQTRLNKIQMGVVDATMLARAGLNRLKISGIPAYDIPAAECLPAVAQGAIGIECRADNENLLEKLQTINCANTMAATLCERAFLHALDGSCRTPIAGYARIEKGHIYFDGLMINPDGTNLKRIGISGVLSDAKRLGKEAGEKLRAF